MAEKHLGPKLFALAAGIGVLFGPFLPSCRALLPRAADHLMVRRLEIGDAGGKPAILLGMSGEESPAMWLQSKTGGSAQAGLHGNGFPFLLSSDTAVLNFALARVDGKMASPIMVYRVDDRVRIILGLSMTDPAQPFFFSYWTADGKQHNLIGDYCTHPSRACLS